MSSDWMQYYIQYKKLSTFHLFVSKTNKQKFYFRPLSLNIVYSYIPSFSKNVFHKTEQYL